MQTIAVIFGGKSAEHDVSIVTALSSIIKPLELSKRYQVEAIYIAKDGSWHWDNKLKDISYFTNGKIDSRLTKSSLTSVRFDGGMTIEKNSSGRFGRRSSHKKIDVVFPALHGTYGEDGALMGLLDMAGIAYVGCGLASSVLAMDKSLAKTIAQASNINVSKFLTFNKANSLANPDQIIESIKNNLTMPLFVKPAHLGSSIGISRVTDTTELKNALEVAYHYDDKLIVEQEVANLIEVTLPIIGNDQPIPALLEKPLAHNETFFGFESKYLRGGKKGQNDNSKGAQGYSEIPAQLPKPLYDQAEKLAIKVYRALGCNGIARVDMLIDSKTQQVYFNEVNPLPGSLYAHNWAKAGVSGVRLVEQLVDFALERHQHRNELTTVFATSYLQQF